MSGNHAPLFEPKDPLLLAFHLPQFHPIPENDQWWGPGFTEWTNVTRGRPLFRGHYQPHLPAELGFYDLRLPEVREQQAALAREAGLGGFVYYHYWFNGQRLLERPVNDLLAQKQPDFPFCLCWANEAWSRNWDGQNKSVLMAQDYSPADDLNHIQWLLSAFADDRYIKISGRPIFLIYRPSLLPNIRQTVETWRREAQKAGWPDLYLCAVRSFPGEFCDAAQFGMDGSVDFKPNGTDCGAPLSSDNPLDIGYRLHKVWDYDTMIKQALSLPWPDYNFFPSVCPSWDNSARRKEGATIFKDASPVRYRQWLLDVLIRDMFRPRDQALVFVNAWNEWAEGNHLEPCQRWGRGYIDATRQAMQAARAFGAEAARYAEGHVLAAANDASAVAGHVDSREAGPGGIKVNGWHIDSASKEPLDLIVSAIKQNNGTYRLFSMAQAQRLPRPDVAKALAHDRSLLCGWELTIPASRLHAAMPDLHLLGLRLRDGTAFHLSALGS